MRQAPTPRIRADLTVAPTWVQRVVGAFRVLGLDVPTLAARAGLDRVALRDPLRRVPRDASGLLWRAALEATGDPLLGLRAGRAAPLGFNSAVSHAAICAPHLLAALRTVVRLQRTVAHAEVLSLHRREGQLGIGLAKRGGALEVTHAELEFMAVVLHRLASMIVATEVPLCEVWLAHPAPLHADEHARTFGAPVRFAAGANRLWMRREVSLLPSPHANPHLLPSLEGLAEEALARVGEVRVEEEARAHLRSGLRAGRTELADVAASMGLSPRTLQRRLAGAGTSHRDLLDAVRRERALVLMADPARDASAIAASLGFSDRRAFARAFRRWTGESPGAFRRTLPPT